MIHQNAFTIMASISSGKEQHLRKHLSNFNTENILPFHHLKSIHFLRVFIIDELIDLDDNIVTPARLVISSNFDGSVKAQYELLAFVAEKEIDGMFSFCDNYPEPRNRNIETRTSFLKNNDQGTNLFWAGDVGGTVQLIHQENELRNFIEQEVTKNQYSNWKGYSSSKVREAIVEKISKSEYKWALTARPKNNLSYILKRIGVLLYKVPILIIVVLGIILPLSPFLFLTARYLELKMKRKLEKNPPKQRNLDEVLSSEDLVMQNQLTIYATLAKPYWFKKTILKSTLWLFRLNGGYLATKGVLSGITTIHFARWVLFDDYKYIMFCSNYDGAWESYLGEFIDRAAAPMNLTFGQSYGYPPVKWLFWDGAFDEQAFKHVVRQHQYPVEFFYTAYPNLTIKNILNNKELRQGLSKKHLSAKKLDAWLHRI